MATSLLQKWREKQHGKYRQKQPKELTIGERKKAYRPKKITVIEGVSRLGSERISDLELPESLYVPLKQLPDGTSIPSLGVGMWSMPGGDKGTKYVSLDAMAAERGLKLGLNFIGTAGMSSELNVASVLKLYKRESIFLAAEIVIERPHYYDTLNAATYTLKRLKTKYLDLALVNLQDQPGGLPQVAKAIDHLMKKKVIKHLGVVNCTVDQMAALSFHLNHKIIANLLRYSLVAQQPERSGMLSYCRDHGMFVISHHPLSTKILKSKSSVPLMKKLCQKYKATPSQIGLNWLLFQPNVLVLDSMSRMSEFPNDTLSLGFQLTGSEFEELKQAFA